ncbi:MAG TPA: hypothetical protein DCO79_08070 [Spirochaeta sp.]|nr:hypothetical protein [Spirochaeta sp.]
MKLTTIAFRNLGRHRRRTVLSISTITLSCVFGLFMLALITGMKSDMKNNIIAYYTGAVQIRHSEYNKYDYLNPIHLHIENEGALREELLNVEGVTQAAARITAGGKIYIDDNNDDDIPGLDYNAVGIGIDFAIESEILAPEQMLISGRLPEPGRREVLLGAALAEKAGLKPGDKFSFLTQTAARSANAMTFKVAGLVNFSMGQFNSSRFLIPLSAMQDLMMMPDGAQEILVMTEDPDKVKPLLAAIDRFLATRSNYSYTEAISWKTQGVFYPMISLGEIIYNYIVIIFLILGGTVIINTTMMVILERYREIGILGAMGMMPKELVRLFFYEGVFAGIISAASGLVIGSIVVLIFEKTGLNFGAAFDNMNIEISTVLRPELKLYHIVLMGIYTVGITSLVTLIPSKRAAAIEPVQAMRSI